jgi:FdhD protein
MLTDAVNTLPVVKIIAHDRADTYDLLAAEEPLEIRVEFGKQGQREVRNIAVTMRTPGNDAELARGFLFTEGVVKNTSDIASIQHCFIACAENKENVVQVIFKEGITPELKNTERNFYTTSSCGVCGKGSISAIRSNVSYTLGNDHNCISASTLYKLTDILNSHQEVFAETGGLHASALFTTDGKLLLVREDVGRHNALDKLIGAAVELGMVPLTEHVLLLSGRASFELVQKAAMAGINIIAAIGAPSTLAVQMAEEFGITLIGFLRNQRFNIYTGPHRILTSVKL